MEKFFNVIIYGLANGCLYGLIAIGYSMVYSIIGLINFAHGDVFMIGAFFTLTLAGLLQIPSDLSLVPFLGYTFLLLTLTSTFCALVNYLIYKMVYQPLRNAPKLILLVSAIGVSLLLQNFGMVWGAFGPENVMGSPKNCASPKKFPDLASRGVKVFGLGEPAISANSFAEKNPNDGTLKISGPRGSTEIFVSTGMTRSELVEKVNELSPKTGVFLSRDGFLQTEGTGSSQFLRIDIINGSVESFKPGKFEGKDSQVPISKDHLVIFFVTIPVVLFLHFFVMRTKLGKAMRACEQDTMAARLMGINPIKVVSTTFIIGGFLAGTAGVIACYYWGTVRFDMGYTSGLFAFTGAVVGGIGSIAGAMMGGLLLGFARTVTESYLASQWVNTCIFLLLIVFLIFRPSGILGIKSAEKV